MVKLGPHQNDIIEILKEQYNYPRIVAKEIVEKYYQNMEKIGWVYSAEEWAEQLDFAEKNGISPIDWDKQLNKVDSAIESVINEHHESNSQVKVVRGVEKGYTRLNPYMRRMYEEQVGGSKLEGRVFRGLRKKGIKVEGVEIETVNSERTGEEVKFVASLSNKELNSLINKRPRPQRNIKKNRSKGR